MVGYCLRDIMVTDDLLRDVREVSNEDEEIHNQFKIGDASQRNLCMILVKYLVGFPDYQSMASFRPYSTFGSAEASPSFPLP